MTSTRLGPDPILSQQHQSQMSKKTVYTGTLFLHILEQTQIWKFQAQERHCKEAATYRWYFQRSSASCLFVDLKTGLRLYPRPFRHHHVAIHRKIESFSFDLWWLPWHLNSQTTLCETVKSSMLENVIILYLTNPAQ